MTVLSKRFVVAGVVVLAAGAAIFQGALSPMGQFVMTLCVFWGVYHLFDAVGA